MPHKICSKKQPQFSVFPELWGFVLTYICSSRNQVWQELYQFDKCLLQMVGTLHATSLRKKEEERRKKG
ncbi:MAG: hypothetical protein F6K39_33100 [Okeania sp. SIO3B3]|nr:hypothetical protein [Okeania sp. SIO3B3]